MLKMQKAENSVQSGSLMPDEKRKEEAVIH